MWAQLNLYWFLIFATSVQRLLNNLHLLHSWSKHSVCNTCLNKNTVDVSILLRKKSIRKLITEQSDSTMWHLYKCTYSWPVFVYCKLKWNCQRLPNVKKKKVAWSWSTLTAVGDSVMQLLCDKICFEKLRNEIQGSHHWRIFTNSVNIIISMTRQKKYHTECRLTAKSKVVQRSW